tara:strand:+ start:6446 stop:6877 length:432 start_codon:yes stop_codon:yes gene_type:complete
MSTHDLKVWPEFFGDLQDGAKLFELRRDDRPFEEGDWLKLREWKKPDILAATPGGYTGARCMRQIAYVLRGALEHGLQDGFVILGLAPPIMPLAIQLQGKRMFVEGTDPKDAVALSEYLAELAGFVERTKAEVHAAKRAGKTE